MNKILIRQIFTVVVLVAVVGLTVNFGILPQFANFNEKLKSAEQTDRLTSIELDQLRKLQELAEIQPAIEKQLDYLTAAVPGDIEVSNYVDQLDVLAERNSVAIEFLTFGDVAPFVLPEYVASEETVQPYVSKVGESIRAIPVDFAVTGSYANLIAFMGELQSAPRTTVIQSASLSSGQTSRVFNLTIKTLIFYTAQAQ
ncbi:MAG: hypothetical protein ACKOXT_02285 [Actinomycetota bacterium]